jgi:invasion protein IalB
MSNVFVIKKIKMNIFNILTLYFARVILCGFFSLFVTAFVTGAMHVKAQTIVTPAQAIPQSENTAKRVGDWQVFCKEATSPAVKSMQNCRLVQSHAMDAEAKSIFMFSVMNDSAKGGLFALVTVPLEIYLAPGIVLEGENKKPYKVLYEICNMAGCHGGFKLTPEVLTLLKGAKPIVARVWTTTNKALSVSLSPKGFEEAVKSVNEPAK